MKFTIYDDNKTDVLTTNNLTEAYDFLVANIPPLHMCKFEQLQNEINFDIEHDKSDAVFGFYINEAEKKLYRLRVTYA